MIKLVIEMPEKGHALNCLDCVKQQIIEGHKDGISPEWHFEGHSECNYAHTFNLRIDYADAEDDLDDELYGAYDTYKEAVEEAKKQQEEGYKTSIELEICEVFDDHAEYFETVHFENDLDENIIDLIPRYAVTEYFQDDKNVIADEDTLEMCNTFQEALERVKDLIDNNNDLRIYYKIGFTLFAFYGECEEDELLDVSVELYSSLD